MFLPRGRTKREKTKSFLPHKVVNIWGCLEANWFFLNKQKHTAFLCTVQGPLRYKRKLEHVISNSEMEKKNLTLSPTKLRFISGSPSGRRPKFSASITQGQATLFSGGDFPQFCDLWRRNRDNSRQSDTLSEISTWSRKVRFIIHCSVARESLIYVVYYN